MVILGINAYHGDTAAALVADGKLIAAVEEERFRRIKHCAGFPLMAIQECLRFAGVSAHEIDHFAISRDPKANLLKRVQFVLSKKPSARFIVDRARNQSRVSSLTATIAEELRLDHSLLSSRVNWVEHHPSHLSSAFFVSPFDQAAVCAIDGFGDFVSTSLAIGRGSRLDVIKRVFYPHSLGLLYLAITQYLGFWKYGDEYKVMGLASYGQPDYANEIRQLIRLLPRGDFQLNLEYFRHWSDGVAMTWADGEPHIGPVFTSRLEQLLGPARNSEQPIDSRHEAIAASVQVVFEEAVFHILNALYERTRLKNLCLAGGCAMNSVANGKIRHNTAFESLYVQPAAGDSGTALGAAFHTWNQLLRNSRGFVMEHAYWGPEFGANEVRWALNARKEEISQHRSRSFDNEQQLCEWTAGKVDEGKVVGWFQGRMEWGARALGNRSIVADPRREDMRDIINTKIKFRERFRPFAPSILEENLDEYFVGATRDPFMIQVYPVRKEKRRLIPSVTHVDGSGRLQTVSRGTNPIYWNLIKAFEKRTSVPVLLNTSFNENEPIVQSPTEAIDCFLRTNIDALVLGTVALEKHD